MAAPQFSTSGTKPASSNRRRFSLEQANRALPLITRIVRDIVNASQNIADLEAKLEDTPVKLAPVVQAQLDHSRRRLAEFGEELTDIGVELKDIESGLIDFPGRHQGRDVFLCWKLGEDKVEYWHELHAGFAGRQPIRSLREGD